MVLTDLEDSEEAYSQGKIVMIANVIAPVTVAMVIVVMFMLALLAMHDYSAKWLTSFADSCIVQGGPLIVALSVLIVAVAAALQVGAATRAGLVCANIDVYSLAVIA